MFEREDKTFFITRERSVEQWLLEMSEHEDLAVRDGVRATRDYIDDLKKQIEMLERKNDVKETYLKKLKQRKDT